MNFRSLLTRTLSGAVLLIIMISMMKCQYGFSLMLAIISFGSLYEFYKISTLSTAKIQRVWGYLLMLIVFGLNSMVFLKILDIKYLVLIMPAFLLPFVVELYRNTKNPVANISATISGVVYCSLGTISLMYLSAFSGEYMFKIALGYFILVWTNDVGAYLVGMSIGRRKLFERLSPKKSWEGFFGGVAFTIALAMYFANIQGFSLVFGAGLGVVISVSGVAGDLIESMFKRSVDVKDSGSIIPGHGGFLDRFDALLISAPLTLIYFIIFT
ncbi:MAG: phosphatidate cytidylyltransferase [Rikenellaceae bacterium]